VTAFARRAGVLAALAALVACTTPSPPAAPENWITGRLTLQVASDSDRPAQNLTAGFELQGLADLGELRLISPLGTQLAAVRWGQGQASLQTGQGRQVFDSLDELSRLALGEVLPLAALPSWLAGRPWAGLPHRLHEQGFEQAGWQVLLTRQALGLIEARRAAPPAVVLRVRLDMAP
jgi:outer membrane lipoprotein LolB